MPTRTAAETAALAAQFRSALLSQGTVIFLVFVLLAIAWVACRELVLAHARTRLLGKLAARRASQQAEPTGRLILRIGFGVLWIFDGLLQAQPEMPARLPSDVIAAAVGDSPGWVVRTVSWAATGWSAHPVQAAAGAVWIQLGIGVWLLSAGSPRWSRAAGLVSVGWGLVIWVFGEAFGSMLAPGPSWLTGAPGAALFYCAAGLLLALPLAAWHGSRIGRWIVRTNGALLLGLAILQAWPGRGYWQGRSGSLTAAVGNMAAMRQPAVTRGLAQVSGSFIASHGFAVNLSVVIALTVIGACLLSGRALVARPAALAGIALCLADWVFVQDLGFLGGLGTDPNSMLPQALILAAALAALGARTELVPAGQPAQSASSRDQPMRVPLPAGAPRDTRRLGQLPGRAVRSLGLALGTAGSSAVLTLWAAAMLVLGVVPMVVEFARLG
jgi:hypothetical protein